ncbi:MAG: YkgJ family cysteine cluster protein [Thermodesulfobacteriota bacterium]
MSANPCLSCGACCAHFRASFYWAESDDATENGVPAELCDKLNDFFLVMKGTNQKDPWCTALLGIIGKSVCCSIYERRSTVCREFVPSFEHGERNPRCDAARNKWGLEPLTPDHWLDPRPFPKAA